MPTMSGIRMTTALGEVQVTARGDGTPSAMLSVRADGAPPIRRMPEGMRLEGGALVIVEGVFAAGGVVDVSMTLHPFRPVPDGAPNTGEHLDCVVMSSGDQHLALAARDQEWMAARQPDVTGYDVSLSPRGLTLTVHPNSAGARFSVPLALAWASGPDPLAVWYGADAILPI